MLDTLDVRIMRAYFQDRALSPLKSDFRASIAVIAKMVGEDEDTVRHRLRKFQDSGFVTDWRLFVNHAVWGGGHLSIWFDVDPAAPKRELVDKLRLVPGLTHVSSTYGSLIAFLAYDDEREVPRQIDLTRKVVGIPEAFVARDAFPPCTIQLSSRDWDIIRALRKNPRMHYADLAQRVGITSRTAKARVTRLASSGVIFEWPTLNLHALEGGTLVYLFVLYPEERKAEVDRAITTRLEPYLWHMMHMMPYRQGDLWPCGYDLVLPNLSMAREVLDWARGVPGVVTARTYLYEDLVNFLDTFDQELERRLSVMPSARRGVRGGKAFRSGASLLAAR